MNILPQPFGIHETALRAKSRQLELLATNLANGDTPHFKARAIDFKQLLGQVQQDTMKTTDTRHYPLGEDAGSADGVKYRVPFNASVDGNTVEMSVEQAQYGKAATEYRASLMFIENRTNTIKRALRGE